MASEYIEGKHKLLGFLYSPSFSQTISKIHYVCKSDINQIDFSNRILRKILKGEFNPSQTKIVLENSQLFDASQVTIILSILTTDVLDPLKEALDAVYNGPVVNTDTVALQTTLNVQVPIQNIPNVRQDLRASQLAPRQSSEPKRDIDPLDIFDKAKSDVMATAQGKETSIQKETIVNQESELNKESQNVITIETKTEPFEEIKKEIPVSSNPLKINMAAVLGEEKNNNVLVLQDNQTIAQLSQILKNNNPIIENEDLNLYIPNAENTKEIPKPLIPTAPDADIETEEIAETDASLQNTPAPSTITVSLIDAQAVKPAENTIKGNMSQSHLKFSQRSDQEIPANKSYSKLLEAMSPKFKTQPQIVTTLRDTFANPDRYSTPQEILKPKPKKYTLVGDVSDKSVVIRSSQESSNKESNAIIGKEIDNDIINLAQNISREETTIETTADEPRGPIIYTKQAMKENDAFGRDVSDKSVVKEKTKNSNIIDLS